MRDQHESDFRLEFSLDEICEWLGRFFAGGSVQMLLVGLPIALALFGWGLNWQAAVLLASALAFSSTVLVFKALSEVGEAASGHGRSAIGILLFQDAALVPLLLLAPLLTSDGNGHEASDYLALALKSILFIASVFVSRRLVSRFGVPIVVALRNTELTILFVLAVVVGEQSREALLRGQADQLALSGSDSNQHREELVRLAERSGCHIEIVADSPLLDGLGGVGCVLRYLTAEQHARRE